MADRVEPTVETGETAPGAPTPPAVRKRGRRLGSLANVRSALADVVRRLESGELDIGKARALVYALSELSHTIQTSDLEERLVALEERAERRGRA